MFTGIVQAMGEVVEAGAGRLAVRSEALRDVAEGASVAVAGVCLTATGGEGDVRSFDLTPETLGRTTLGALGAGDRVNLERPLRAGEEMGGHIVQGHVDATVEVRSVREDGGSRLLELAIDDHLARYLVEKGNVTLDGVSLTVSGVGAGVFEVALVPHTLEVTTLGRASTGTRHNVEVDVLAKYVERLATPWVTVSGAGESYGYL